MHINIWIALKQTAFNTLRPLLDDDTYDGQHLTAVKIFRRMINHGAVDRMFKTPTIAGDMWQLFSLTFNDLSKDAAIKVQNALDYLDSNYSNQFETVGAWFWDGRQIGTQWINPEDHSLGTTGTPVYPINSTQLLKFMPDVWDYTDPENPVLIPAIELTDVILVQGQSSRHFS